ncbi:MAG: hypothetical protein U0350_33070 [Caldilineaceae bacterium]
MKRVIRDVIKIVTTIRRLPEEHSQVHLTIDSAGAEIPGSEQADDDVSAQTSAAWANTLSDTVYTTYLLIYRVVDE